MKNSFSKNLAKLLQQKGVSVSVAARKAGMNRSTLHNYCNGIVPRQLHSLEQLAQYLDVSLSELINGEEPQPQNILNIEGKYEVTVKHIGQLPNKEKA